MIPYVPQPNQYSRDPNLIGNDIALIPGEDIALDNGDIKLITNVDSIYAGILRRLYTSKLDYERLFKTVDGLIITGATYGNNSFNYLSSLNNSINRNYVIDEIKRIIEDEPRIALDNIEFTDTTANAIQIEVTYRILSNNQLANLIL